MIVKLHNTVINKLSNGLNLYIFIILLSFKSFCCIFLIFWYYLLFIKMCTLLHFRRTLSLVSRWHFDTSPTLLFTNIFSEIMLAISSQFQINCSFVAGIINLYCYQQVEDNINLFCRTRNNLNAILNEYVDAHYILNLI